MYNNILIPTDGSKGVQKAIDHGIELADWANADIHSIFVVDLQDYVAALEGDVSLIEDAIIKEGENALKKIEDRCRQKNIDIETNILYGTPHEKILEYTEEHEIDLIIMGTHGRSGLDRFLLGSVTDKVIRKSDIPVLTTRIE